MAIVSGKEINLGEFAWVLERGNCDSGWGFQAGIPTKKMVTCRIKREKILALFLISSQVCTQIKGEGDP